MPDETFEDDDAPQTFGDLVRAFGPFALLVLIVGTLLGTVAALVPVVGWLLATLFGTAFVALVVADHRENRRRDAHLLAIVEGDDEDEEVKP